MLTDVDEQMLTNTKSVSHLLHLISLKKDELLIFSPDFQSESEEKKRDIVEKSNKLWAFYDRATLIYPRSYKIWYEYIEIRTSFVTLQKFEYVYYRKCNGLYERALQNLYFCPVLWINYLRFLSIQGHITLLRKTFNRALQSLPITQHDKIWMTYLPLIRETKMINTVDEAYQRYIKLHPEHVEDAAIWFYNQKAPLQAARYLQIILDNPNFRSIKEKPKVTYWLMLTDQIMENPNIPNAEKILLDVRDDVILEPGRVWSLLGKYYASVGRFMEAIQVFEDALESIRTAHDFKFIFNDLSKLYKDSISHLKNAEKKNSFVLRLSHLISRTGLLLNLTKIRQNKDDIYAWINASKYIDLDYDRVMYRTSTRFSIFQQIEKHIKHDRIKMYNFLQEALETVSPKHAFNGLFADIYVEIVGISDNPSFVYAISLLDNSLTATDIEYLYLHYCEYLLINNRLETVRDIINGGLSDPRIVDHEIPNLWNFALDIEWSYGTTSSICELFERCLQSRSVTIRHFVGYAKYLEDNELYDNLFRVYEKAISFVGDNNNSILWLHYLYKFVFYNKNQKVERTRDLFDEAIKAAQTKEDLQYLYILYSDFEEKYGMNKRAMIIYKRFADYISDELTYQIWVCSTHRIYGVAKSREIYEYAILKSNGEAAGRWAMKYASFEIKLGELDRARDIYINGSQFADPNKFQLYWDTFEAFEQKYGTTETYKNMLSLKNYAIEKYGTDIHMGTINEDQSDDEQVEEIENLIEQDELIKKVPDHIYQVGLNQKIIYRVDKRKNKK